MYVGYVMVSQDIFRTIVFFDGEVVSDYNRWCRRRYIGDS
jgi:hypothetical protein